MKQLWHKAKALFGFGPQEAEPLPEPMIEHADDPAIARAFDERFMPARDAQGAIAWPPATANSLNRLAVMAQPVAAEMPTAWVAHGDSDALAEALARTDLVRIVVKPPEDTYRHRTDWSTSD